MSLRSTFDAQIAGFLGVWGAPNVTGGVPSAARRANLSEPQTADLKNEDPQQVLHTIICCRLPGPVGGPQCHRLCDECGALPDDCAVAGRHVHQRRLFAASLL